MFRGLTRAMSATPTIITHSGKFHCDEALAVGLLRLLPAYSSSTLIRTRDPAVIATGDVVVDVGGVYDPSAHRYDHHQRGFDTTLSEEHSTKLSSAGLVYKHFGKDVIATLAADLGPEDTELVYDKIYTSFVEAIDAIDNGIPRFSRDAVPAYADNKTDLGSRISHLNPRWNQDVDDQGVAQRFEAAVALATEAFVGKVESLVHSWIPARDLVAGALEKAGEIDPSGEIFFLETMCPWKGHLKDYEAAHGIDGKLKYALFADSGGMWRIMAVPVQPDSFESRLKLPEAWRGVRDADLDAVTGEGVPQGAKFVHASGFIGGHETYEGVLAMARVSLQQSAQ